ncbi:MAG: hypothetical protein OEX07_03705 [Gammaproteobacteria bacterium]|nr:hypothetical protein [Gammaproteobacteria bacterium]
MSNQKLWFGFLEAGVKSSPVVRSSKIDPGRPDNMYLYNLNADAILLYKTSIVESKLRDLSPAEEKEFMSKLESGFKKASKDFKCPSTVKLYSTSSKTPAKTETSSNTSDTSAFDVDDVEIDLDTEIEVDDESETADEDL